MNPNSRRFPFLSLMLGGLLAATLALGAFVPAALATDLPPTVMSYLRSKDPQVKVRFDGVVIFPNGESYVPVIPQDMDLAANPKGVLRTIPETKPEEAAKAYPDYIEFDNHFFLVRLIQTQSGRLTLPKLEEYPIELKEGLLPQDLVLPNNLFIPVELKVLLGALPYNPKFVPTDTLIPAAPQLASVRPKNASGQAVGTMANPHIYLFDLSNQKVASVHPETGAISSDLPLDCVPSSLQLSPDGKLLFAPCMSTNELVVIDTHANLVKTRIPVGSRPEHLLYVKPQGQILVSNRFSTFLNLISAHDLLPGKQVKIPGNGGLMAEDSRGEYAYVADLFKPLIYRVNLKTAEYETSIPSIANVSAMAMIPVGSPDGPNELWLASRTANEVVAVNPVDGKVRQRFKVGEKPVALAQHEDKLYVVSAGEARLDVIDLKTRALGEPIALRPDSFPSDIAVVRPENKAYIPTAGAEELYVVNLKSGQLESTLPLSFRSTTVTLMETDKVPEPPAQSAAQSPLPAVQETQPSQEAARQPQKDIEQGNLFSRLKNARDQKLQTPSAASGQATDQKAGNNPAPPQIMLENANGNVAPVQKPTTPQATQPNSNPKDGPHKKEARAAQPAPAAKPETVELQPAPAVQPVPAATETVRQAPAAQAVKAAPASLPADSKAESTPANAKAVKRVQPATSPERAGTASPQTLTKPAKAAASSQPAPAKSAKAAAVSSPPAPAVSSTKSVKPAPNAKPVQEVQPVFSFLDAPRPAGAAVNTPSNPSAPAVTQPQPPAAQPESAAPVAQPVSGTAPGKAAASQPAADSVTPAVPSKKALKNRQAAKPQPETKTPKASEAMPATRPDPAKAAEPVPAAAVAVPPVESGTQAQAPAANTGAAQPITVQVLPPRDEERGYRLKRSGKKKSSLSEPVKAETTAVVPPPALKPPRNPRPAR